MFLPALAIQQANDATPGTVPRIPAGNLILQSSADGSGAQWVDPGSIGGGGTGAVSTTAANYTQPAVSGNVAVTFANAGFTVPGAYLAIQAGGNYQVVGVSGVVVTLQRTDTSGATTGASVSTGALAVPSGPPGAAGANGAAGAAGAKGTGLPGVDAVQTATFPGTYSAGTWTATASGALAASIFDGHAVAIGESVAFNTGGTPALGNGVFIRVADTAGQPTFTRRSDANTGALLAGAFFAVLQGDHRGRSLYVTNSGSITLDTTFVGVAEVRPSNPTEFDLTLPPWNVQASVPVYLGGSAPDAWSAIDRAQYRAYLNGGGAVRAPIGWLFCDMPPKSYESVRFYGAGEAKTVLFSHSYGGGEQWLITFNARRTSTIATFVQPAIGSNVTVNVADSSAFNAGQAATIEGGGAYTVASITDSTHVVLTNAGGEFNLSPGVTVPANLLCNNPYAPGPTVDTAAGATSIALYDRYAEGVGCSFNLTRAGLRYNKWAAATIKYLIQPAALTGGQPLRIASTRGAMVTFDVGFDVAHGSAPLTGCAEMLWLWPGGQVSTFIRAWHASKTVAYGTTPPTLTLSGITLSDDTMFRLEALDTTHFRLSCTDGAAWQGTYALASSVTVPASTGGNVQGRIAGLTLGFSATTFAAHTASGSPSVTFTAETAVRATGDWGADGFANNDWVTITGTANNNGRRQIYQLTGTTMTFTGPRTGVPETTSAGTYSGVNQLYVNWELLTLTSGAGAVTTGANYEIDTTFDGASGTVKLYVTQADGAHAYNLVGTATTSLTGSVLTQMVYEDNNIGWQYNDTAEESGSPTAPMPFYFGAVSYSAGVETLTGNAPTSLARGVVNQKFFLQPTTTNERRYSDGSHCGFIAEIDGGYPAFVAYRRITASFLHNIGLDHFSFECSDSRRAGLSWDASTIRSYVGHLKFNGGAYGLHARGIIYATAIEHIHASNSRCDFSFYGVQFQDSPNLVSEGTGIPFYVNSSSGQMGHWSALSEQNPHCAVAVVGCTGSLMIDIDDEGTGGYTDAAIILAPNGPFEIRGVNGCANSALGFRTRNTGVTLGQPGARVLLNCGASQTNPTGFVQVAENYGYAGTPSVEFGPAWPATTAVPLCSPVGYAQPYGTPPPPQRLYNADATVTIVGSRTILWLATGTLTANRSYTLPDTGASEGYVVELCMGAQTTYSAVVKDGSGATIDTLAAGVRGTFRYRHNGTHFVLLG